MERGKSGSGKLGGGGTGSGGNNRGDGNEGKHPLPQLPLRDEDSMVATDPINKDLKARDPDPTVPKSNNGTAGADVVSRAMVLFAQQNQEWLTLIRELVGHQHESYTAQMNVQQQQLKIILAQQQQLQQRWSMGVSGPIVAVPFVPHAVAVGSQSQGSGPNGQAGDGVAAVSQNNEPEGTDGNPPQDAVPGPSSAQGAANKTAGKDNHAGTRGMATPKHGMGSGGRQGVPEAPRAAVDEVAPEQGRIYKLPIKREFKSSSSSDEVEILDSYSQDDNRIKKTKRKTFYLS